MTTENTLTTQDKKTKANELAIKLDELALGAQEALQCKGSFERAIAMGIAVNDLREALTSSVMTSIMKLKGSQLGFRTDERPASNYNKAIIYEEDTVKECLIVATCMGLAPVGNQWNILAGRCYVTKEGMTHLLRNLDGLSNLKIIYHPAEIKESSTSGVSKNGNEYQKVEREGIVSVDLSWEFHGKPSNERLEFCIKVNNGMSQDAIIGKAERKAKAWLYSHLTETSISDGDVEEAAFEPRNVTPPKQDNAVQSPIDDVDTGEDEELPSLDGSVIQVLFDKAANSMITTRELHARAIALGKLQQDDATMSADTAQYLLDNWEETKVWIMSQRKKGASK